jgi:hypothetical protein
MIYGYVNSENILLFTTNNNTPQQIDGLTCVQVDFDIGNPPSIYSVFNYQTKQWVDPRTDQQKYELACEQIIGQRNQFLYESDWTQIPNNPLTPEKQQEWADYRQQLRDITQQSGYPFNVIWPTPPQG